MPDMTVVFHDSALLKITEQVAAYPPERGGLLVGPPGVPVISDFLADQHANATGVTFQLSPECERRLHKFERAGYQLKGVLHSHPSGLPRPSGGDEGTFTNMLHRMPDVPYLVTPIVTHTPRSAQVHQISLPPHGVMSVFTASQSRSGHVVINPVAVKMLPVQEVLADLKAWGARTLSNTVNYLHLEGHQYAGLSITLPQGGSGTLLLPPGYPMSSPILLADGVHVPLLWDLAVPEPRRLIHALQTAQVQRPDFNPKVLRGWAENAGGAASVGGDEIRVGLRARLDGAVASSVAAKHVLVVGLGSGGSQTVDALVRSSVEHLTVVDPDDVEAANLSRSVYTSTHVGRSKVDAISEHAVSINPAVKITGYTQSVDEFTPEQLAQLVDSADILIAATDDPDAQYRLNRVAFQAGVPAVFAGVYERGTAGEVIFTVPGLTACFRCATGGKRGGTRGTAQLNYGTGTLLAEPALGPDITHVVSASVKIVIGLLECTDPEAGGHSSAFMVASALGRGMNFLQLAMVAKYPGFPESLQRAPGQHAYQSMWLKTMSDPDCSVCGSAPEPDSASIAVDIDAVVKAVAVEAQSGAGELVDFEVEFADVLGPQTLPNLTAVLDATFATPSESASEMGGEGTDPPRGIG